MNAELLSIDVQL